MVVVIIVAFLILLSNSITAEKLALTALKLIANNARVTCNRRTTRVALVHALIAAGSELVIA